VDFLECLPAMTAERSTMFGSFSYSPSGLNRGSYAYHYVDGTAKVDGLVGANGMSYSFVFNGTPPSDYVRFVPQL
jgi:hypothetical protein